MTPSIRTSILRMVAEHFPALVYGYPRTYVVAAVLADGRLDLVPPPDAQHLPELEAVEQWGLGVVTPSVGSSVCVMFRDADPSRRAVVSWGFGAVPNEVAIDADDVILGAGAREAAAPGAEAGIGIAYGDTVQMFLGIAMTATPIKLMRAGTVATLAGNPAAGVSKVTL